MVIVATIFFLATNYPHAGDTLQVVAAAAASNKGLFTCRKDLLFLIYKLPAFFLAL
jgi:hypothetical protein